MPTASCISLMYLTALQGGPGCTADGEHQSRVYPAADALPRRKGDGFHKYIGIIGGAEEYRKCFGELRFSAIM